MTLRTVAVVIALSLALAACKEPGPSPEYAKAREAWSALLREKLDDAYSDPRADEVLSLLARVRRDSLDAPYAAELKAEITAGRKQAKARAQEQGRVVATVEAAMREQPTFHPDRDLESAAATAVEEAPALEAAAPAAAAGTAQPEDGMAAAEFRANFGRCFEYRHDALVGGLSGGQVWGLKNLGVCRDLHPDFRTRSVLLFDGKATIRPDAELQPQRFRVVDNKLVPAKEAEAKQAVEAKAVQADSPAP